MVRLVALATSLLIIAGYRLLIPATSSLLTALYLLVVVFMAWSAVAATITPRRGGSLAAGRLLAIVPVYNESAEVLLDVVESLRRQTRQPDRIIVVDDGSAIPIRVVTDERVTLIRQQNRGKRWAQITALLAYPDADYVLTVDSDSICEQSACERSLERFSDERVQAVTGMPVLANWSRNLLTRLVDLEISVACLVGRQSRSYMGVVSPATGAFAMYRSAILYDNVEDYASSGIVGDDRRLAVYALRRGRVEALNEALVAIEMPHTLRGSYRQRARWFRAFWRFLPWEVAVLPNTALFFRVWALVFGAVTPLVLVWMFFVIPWQSHAFYWQGIVFWTLVAYTQTLPYLLRPYMRFRDKLGSWLVLTPPLLVWQMLVIRPALVWALVRCRNDGWSTRPGAELLRPAEGRQRIHWMGR